jgi:hypothetical protein
VERGGRAKAQTNGVDQERLIMDRSFADWEAEALQVDRMFDHRITRLGNEIRDHWSTWRHQQEIFTSWKDAMEYTLGVGSEALRLRNYRRGSGANPKESHAKAK